MLKRFLSLSLAAVFLATAALAGAFHKTPHVGRQGDTQTLTEVKVCPMNGEAVTDADAPSEVVGNYKVYFCCAHHKVTFSHLSRQEQERKIAVALKKQSKRS